MSNRASEWPDDYDARLIAAAPEMLEALVKTTIWIEENFEPTRQMEENIKLVEKVTGRRTWDEIKAADRADEMHEKVVEEISSSLICERI
jgi:hypothetical protein